MLMAAMKKNDGTIPNGAIAGFGPMTKKYPDAVVRQEETLFGNSPLKTAIDGDC
jgi:hypothetical protein